MFGRSTKPTRHLLVGNAGPAFGLESDAIAAALATLGCTDVHVPQLLDKEAGYVSASFGSEAQAVHALEALNEEPCSGLDDRVLTARFAAMKAGSVATAQAPVHISRTGQECGVPGLSLHLEFVSEAEEQALLAAVDAGAWETLARRRVQHYGFEFRYLTRDVDPATPAAPLPLPVVALLGRLQTAAAGNDSSSNGTASKGAGSVSSSSANAGNGTGDAANGAANGFDAASGAAADVNCGERLDQLTVNEYAPGVGLSPHIDTHSAFTGAILSLSLAGPAVMQFRRGGERRAIFLPPRSLLVLAGEARYAWRQDAVGSAVVQRAARRVSFTFRQARGFPCDCGFPNQCDSQLQRLPPMRHLLAARAAAGSNCVDDATAAYSSGRGSSGAAEHAHNGLGEPAGIAASTAAIGGSAQANGAAVGPAAADAAQRPVQVPPAETDCPMAAPAGAVAAAAGTPSGGEDGADAACQQMEDRFVNDVYNAIAPHFNSTRFAVWPKVRAFLEGFRCGDVIADVGCGNGKYFGVRRDVAILASDRSTGLAAVAARRLATPGGIVAKADVAVADAFTLPYREGSCDGALCIAVLHHIASGARRRRLLQRLVHILRPGGRVLVTVWAYEQEEQKLLAKWQRIQPRPPSEDFPFSGGGSKSSTDGDSGGGNGSSHDGASATLASSSGDELNAASGGASGDGGGTSCGGGSLDYMVPWHLPFHRMEAAAVAARTMGAEAGASMADGAAAAPQQTAEAPFARVDKAKNSIVFDRFYHLFRRGELEALAAEVPGAAVAESFYDKSNWCIVLQRDAASACKGE